MKLDTRKLSMAGGSVLAVLVVLGLALMQSLLAATPVLADSCSNAAERFGASANLPDCRAYELVTPQVKEDNSNLFSAFGFDDGEHVIYNSIAPFPGAENGAITPVLSYRTPGGWTTRALAAPQGPGESETLFSGGQADPLFMGILTSDFSTAFVDSTFSADPRDQNLSHDVYRIDVASGATSLESLPDSGPMTESIYRPPGAFLGEVVGSILNGASADGDRVYFSDIVPIPTAPGTPAETPPGVGVELYERHNDHTYLVGVLPDGSIPSCGAELGEGGLNSLDSVYNRYMYGAVAPDGSNVVFHIPAEHRGSETPGCNPEVTDPRQERALYLREDNGTPQARTVKLPGIAYLGRSADAAKIFSGGDLEGDAGGGPLYEYDVATEQTIKIGTGRFLTSSADGSVVYYLANPVDIKLGGAEQRLMVYDHGATREVPGAGPGYAGKAFENGVNYLGFFALESLPVTTPDGSKLLFLDRADLTAYNSAGPGCAALNTSHKGAQTYLLANCDEAYIYDLGTGSFTCVSCSPDGTPPSSGTELFIPPGFNQEIPQWTNSLTQDGSRAFFETANPLVPQDTNGRTDVYEWENDHIYLISSGQGSQGSRVDGVSSSGNDVIFQTADALLPQDIESSTQIYDARVGGGFPYTTPVYGCDSGQCQGPQTPAPAFSPPASATFVGVGNPPVQSVATTPSKSAKSKSKAKPKRKAKHTPKRRKGSGRGSHNRNRKGSK
jgi:hypothetical protein